MCTSALQEMFNVLCHRNRLLARAVEVKLFAQQELTGLLTERVTSLRSAILFLSQFLSQSLVVTSRHTSPQFSNHITLLHCAVHLMTCILQA